MSESHLEPAKSIIAKVGGVDVAADVTGKHVSRIYRWMYAKEKGGTGGQIPFDDAKKLLAHSRKNGLGVDAHDFFGIEPLEAAQ